MTSHFEPDPIAAAAAERQAQVDDFTLATLTTGQAALGRLYPIALARSKRARTGRETVVVPVSDLVAACHAMGLLVAILGQVDDQALVEAMAHLAAQGSPGAPGDQADQDNQGPG